MKICVFDPWKYKFSQPIIDHWKEQGHDVRQTLYCDPEWIKWSDVSYFESIDNNLIAWNREMEPTPWRNARPQKKAIARGIDIDLWMRLPLGVDWTMVNDLILIQPWMEQVMRAYLGDTVLPPITVIPCGVDVNKFTYKERINPGFHLAYVGNLWEIKNPARAIEILYALVKKNPSLPWKLTIVGDTQPLKNGSPYYLNHMQWLVEHYGLQDRVEFHTERIEDLVSFYHEIDYMIVTSYKEAFSYVTAEAMSCGVKPVIYHFWNADQIWPKELIYVTHEEAVDIIMGEYHSRQYRDYVADKYPLSKMLESFDKLL